MFASAEQAIEMSSRLWPDNRGAALNLLKIARRKYPDHDQLNAELVAGLLLAGEVAQAVEFCAPEAGTLPLALRRVREGSGERWYKPVAELLTLLAGKGALGPDSARTILDAALVCRDFALQAELAHAATRADPSCREAWAMCCDNAGVRDPALVLAVCRDWIAADPSAAAAAADSFWACSGGFIERAAADRLPLLEQALALWPAESRLADSRLAALIELGRLDQPGHELRDLAAAWSAGQPEAALALVQAPQSPSFLASLCRARLSLLRARGMHPDDMQADSSLRGALAPVPNAALRYIAFEEQRFKRHTAALYCWIELSGREDWHASALGLWNEAHVQNKLRDYTAQADAVRALLVKFHQPMERLRGRSVLTGLREATAPSLSERDYFVRIDVPPEVYRPERAFQSTEFTADGPRRVDVLPFHHSGATIVRRPGVVEKVVPGPEQMYLPEFPFVARRSDVTLVGPDMIPCEDAQFPLLGINFWNDEVASELFTAVCNRDIWSEQMERARVDRAAIHIFSDKCINYYHWTFDMFPRLGLIEQFAELRDLPILVPRDAPRYAVEMLSHVVGPDRMLRIPRTHVICDDLFLVAPTGRQYCYHFSFDWLARRMEPWRAKEPGGERLFLSRRQDRRRGLSNLDEIAAVMADSGFTEFDPGSHSVAEQIRAFSSAEMIVSTFGSAASNIVYARPGTIVIELMPAPGVPMTWQYLGNYMRLRMGMIYGTPAGSENYPYFLSDQQFAIDPALLRKALAEADSVL